MMSATSLPPMEIRGASFLSDRAGVVRHDDGDAGGGGTSCGIEHQQEFDEVLLNRPDQRLDQEDVSFPAVGLQLDFQAVVGEPEDANRMQGRFQVGADLGRQLGVSTTAKDRDISHESSYSI
jgi:hypothetical protein